MRAPPLHPPLHTGLCADVPATARLHPFFATGLVVVPDTEKHSHRRGIWWRNPIHGVPMSLIIDERHDSWVNDTAGVFPWAVVIRREARILNDLRSRSLTSIRNTRSDIAESLHGIDYLRILKRSPGLSRRRRSIQHPNYEVVRRTTWWHCFMLFPILNGDYEGLGAQAIIGYEHHRAKHHKKRRN